MNFCAKLCGMARMNMRAAARGIKKTAPRVGKTPVDRNMKAAKSLKATQNANMKRVPHYSTSKNGNLLYTTHAEMPHGVASSSMRAETSVAHGGMGSIFGARQPGVPHGPGNAKLVSGKWVPSGDQPGRHTIKIGSRAEKKASPSTHKFGSQHKFLHNS